MDDYELLVAEAFRLGSSVPFSNKDAAHARIIAKYLFLDAKNMVCLYSDQLPGAVSVNGSSVDVYDWSPLVEAIESYLLRAKESKLAIKVAMQRGDTASEAMIDLQKKYPNQVDIRWGVGGNTSNFMVNDSDAFRYEYEGNKAIACSNDPKTAKALHKLFQSL